MSKTLSNAVISLFLSLSGGQGKTVATFMAGLKSSKLAMPTLLIDGDPQHNLTHFLGVEVAPRQPTLLEVLKGEVEIEDAIYPVPGRENLFLIPSDRALVNAQYYLASLSNSAYLLRKRLEAVIQDFRLIMIDTPPQKSHISLTAIGSADAVVIPVETTSKGYGSLRETWELLDECREMRAFEGEVVGVLPFRAKWAGHYPTIETRVNLEAMEEYVREQDLDGKNLLLPPLLESEEYKKALNHGKLPSELLVKNQDLEYPFTVLFERLRKFVPEIPMQAVEEASPKRIKEVVA